MRRTAQAGISLVEGMIALTILTFLFLGSITLYVSVGQATVRSSGQTFATADASIASQRVAEIIREGFRAVTPDTTSIQYPFDVTSADFRAAFPTGTKNNFLSADGTFCTGVQLTCRRMLAAANTPKVLNTSGASVSCELYNYTSIGATSIESVWIYRSDQSGNPTPTGRYLWTRKASGGALVTASSSQLLALANPAAPNLTIPLDAVKFEASPTTAELDFALRTAYYSPSGSGRQVTSDTTDGAAKSQVSVRHILLRGTMK